MRHYFLTLSYLYYRIYKNFLLYWDLPNIFKDTGTKLAEKKKCEKILVCDTK